MAFEIDTETLEQEQLKTRIRIAGVGNEGCRMLNLLATKAAHGIELVAFSDRKEDLLASQAPVGILLETEKVRHAKEAVIDILAEESRLKVSRQVYGSDMLIIIVGTERDGGAWLAETVARTAHEMGILTVAVSSTPFACEGRRKRDGASGILDGLRRHTDQLIVLDGESLAVDPGGTESVDGAFALLRKHLVLVVSGLAYALAARRLINASFADISELFSLGDEAAAAAGSASGSGSACNATAKALELLRAGRSTLNAARGLFVAITGQTTIQDLTLAMALIEHEAPEGAAVVISYLEQAGQEGRTEAVLIGVGLERTGRECPVKLPDLEETDFSIPAYVRRNIVLPGTSAAGTPASGATVWTDHIDKDMPHLPAYQRHIEGRTQGMADNALLRTKTIRP